MMIKYVPFLKLKSSEIMALKELDSNLIGELTPFFDYAKRKHLTEKRFIETSLKLSRSLKKNASGLYTFYLDNFDIDTNFKVRGSNNYAYLLSIFNDFTVIPVVSIDRNTEHIDAVSLAKDSGIISANIVAFRVTPEDFQEFDLIKDEVKDKLDEVFSKFREIDLVLDCRVCLKSNPTELADTISFFIKKFCKEYTVRRIIVTGSSIPASIRDITGVDTEVEINRVEIEIFDRVFSDIGDNYSITFGDYGLVSPNYSDIDIPAGAMRNITAPKIIYSYEKKHYVIRGSALQTHPLGNGQYKNLIATMLSKSFCREENYSFGDTYLGQKSRGEGSDATPTTMVKPLCNAHVTYMCKDYV